MVYLSFSVGGYRSAIRQGILALAGVSSAGLVAAQVNLAQSPLFVNKGVTPAIMVALDDSTSMDAETLLKSNDGAAWWNTTDKRYAGRGRDDLLQAGAVNYNEAGNANATWRKYIYLFPNGATGNDKGTREAADSDNDHFAVPPLPQFAYTRSPAYNFSYFDPAVVYKPWPSLGGYTFGDANPTAARTDPVFPTSGTAPVFDLTSQVENSDANNVFRMFNGMTVPAGVRNTKRTGASGTWSTTEYVATDAKDDVNFRAISYFPAQFYLKSSTSVDNCYGYIPSNVSNDGRAPDGTTALSGFEIKLANFRDQCGRTANENYTSAMQNFANWFTYYRKRHAAARNALGAGFESISDVRVGLYRINARPSGTSLTMRDLLVSADRSAFFKQAYESVGAGGTPNRDAVLAMSGQLARKDKGAPIKLQCQKNFGVLITDGFSNPSGGGGVGNRDGAMTAPFADSYKDTMADIAAGLYLDNPRTDLTVGKVPVPSECTAPGAPLRLDCNPNLHLNLFAISLGAPGNIFNVNAAATADPFTNPPVWVNPTSQRNPQQIDDLWHATLNSRGDFLSVDVPSELGDSFRKILESIRARVEDSGGSAAANSAVLQTDSLLYNAQFRSKDWSGELVAKKLDKNGNPGAVEWSAESLLAAVLPADRKIFTSQSSGAGVSFKLSSSDPPENLDASQAAALAVNPTGAPETSATAADRVNWIRGQETALLRSRTSGTTVRRLGDLIGSDPQFMAKTDFGFSLLPSPQGGATYRTFRAGTAYAARANTLFVGSNDGMFHAFDAATGEELFAYIPSEFLAPRVGGSGSHAQINELMRTDYRHRYFVDGTAVVSDAYVSGAWKTLAVGTVGAGGRTVFALDVTDPGSFSASKVLWEFKYSADACVADPTGGTGSTACRDIGEGVTKPKIVRLANGTWAAVFGNGFNSHEHRARLLVVDLNTGKLLYNLLTPDGASASSPNGLSPADVTDWPLNQFNLTNAYAGDLQGNLWRFDFSASSPVTTKIFTAMSSESPSVRQPITARPTLALRPGSTSELVVVFGTGSFIRQGDDATGANGVQTMYGIFDSQVTAVSPPTTTELQTQTITSNTAAVTLGTTAYAAGTLRYVTENAIGEKKGWRIDLPVSSERVVSQATFPSGSVRDRVRLSSLVPDPDPCVGGRRGFLMDISLANGGRFDSPIFDLSGDRAFDSDDKVGSTNVSGVDKSKGELITSIRDSKISLDNLYGGDGSKLISGKINRSPPGRQSWRQLR